MIDELLAHATQRQFVHTHRWRVHDLVMWDNRCTLHRPTVSDIANTCEQEKRGSVAAL